MSAFSSRSIVSMIATICALTTQLSLPASEARAAVDAHFAQQLAKLERHWSEPARLQAFIDEWCTQDRLDHLAARLDAFIDERTSDTAQVTTLRAYVALAMGDTGSALRAFAAAETSTSGNPQILYDHGRVLACAWHIDAARARMQRALTLHPASTLRQEIRAWIGRLDWRTGDVAAATNSWERFLHGGELATLRDRQATLLRIQIDEQAWPAAIATCTALLPTATEAAERWLLCLQLAEIHETTGDRARARQALDQSIQHCNSGSWREELTLDRLRDLFLDDEDQRGWQLHLQAWAEALPERPVFHRRLAHEHRRSGELKEAERILRRVCSTCPDDRASRAALVEVLQIAGENDAAATESQALRAMRDEQASVAGDTTTPAEASSETAVTTTQAVVDLRHRLADALYQEHWQEAAALAERITRQSTEDADRQRAVGLALRAGVDDAALAVLEDWRSKQATDHRPWLLAARVYLLRNEQATAELLLRRGLLQVEHRAMLFTALAELFQVQDAHPDAHRMWWLAYDAATTTDQRRRAVQGLASTVAAGWQMEQLVDTLRQRPGAIPLIDLMQVHHRLRDTMAEQRIWRQLQRRYGDRPAFHRLRRDRLREDGRHAQAIIVASDLLDRTGSNDDRLVLAELHLRNGDATKGQYLLKEVTRTCSEAAEAIRAVALALRWHGPESASALASMVDDRSLQHPRLQYLKAMIALQAGKYDQARTLLLNCLDQTTPGLETLPPFGYRSWHEHRMQALHGEFPPGTACIMTQLHAAPRLGQFETGPTDSWLPIDPVEFRHAIIARLRQSAQDADPDIRTEMTHQLGRRGVPLAGLLLSETADQPGFELLMRRCAEPSVDDAVLAAAIADHRHRQLDDAILAGAIDRFKESRPTCAALAILSRPTVERLQTLDTILAQQDLPNPLVIRRLPQALGAHGSRRWPEAVEPGPWVDRMLAWLVGRRADQPFRFDSRLATAAIEYDRSQSYLTIIDQGLRAMPQRPVRRVQLRLEQEKLISPLWMMPSLLEHTHPAILHLRHQHGVQLDKAERLGQRAQLLDHLADIDDQFLRLALRYRLIDDTLESRMAEGSMLEPQEPAIALIEAAWWNEQRLTAANDMARIAEQQLLNRLLHGREQSTPLIFSRRIDGALLALYLDSEEPTKTLATAARRAALHLRRDVRQRADLIDLQRAFRRLGMPQQAIALAGRLSTAPATAYPIGRELRLHLVDRHCRDLTAKGNVNAALRLAQRSLLREASLRLEAIDFGVSRAPQDLDHLIEWLGADERRLQTMVDACRRITGSWQRRAAAAMALQILGRETLCAAALRLLIAERPEAGGPHFLLLRMQVDDDPAEVQALFDDIPYQLQADAVESLIDSITASNSYDVPVLDSTTLVLRLHEQLDPRQRPDIETQSWRRLLRKLAGYQRIDGRSSPNLLQRPSANATIDRALQQQHRQVHTDLVFRLAEHPQLSEYAFGQYARVQQLADRQPGRFMRRWARRLVIARQRAEVGDHRQLPGPLDVLVPAYWSQEDRDEELSLLRRRLHCAGRNRDAGLVADLTRLWQEPAESVLAAAMACSRQARGRSDLTSDTVFTLVRQCLRKRGIDRLDEFIAAHLGLHRSAGSGHRSDLVLGVDRFRFADLLRQRARETGKASVRELLRRCDEALIGARSAIPQLIDKHWRPDDRPRGGGIGAGLHAYHELLVTAVEHDELLLIIASHALELGLHGVASDLRRQLYQRLRSLETERHKHQAFDRLFTGTSLLAEGPDFDPISLPAARDANCFITITEGIERWSKSARRSFISWLDGQAASLGRDLLQVGIEEDPVPYRSASLLRVIARHDIDEFGPSQRRQLLAILRAADDYRRLQREHQKNGLDQDLAATLDRLLLSGRSLAASAIDTFLQSERLDQLGLSDNGELQRHLCKLIELFEPEPDTCAELWRHAGALLHNGPPSSCISEAELDLAKAMLGSLQPAAAIACYCRMRRDDRPIATGFKWLPGSLARALKRHHDQFVRRPDADPLPWLRALTDLLPASDRQQSVEVLLPGLVASSLHRGAFRSTRSLDPRRRKKELVDHASRFTGPTPNGVEPALWRVLGISQALAMVDYGVALDQWAQRTLQDFLQSCALAATPLSADRHYVLERLANKAPELLPEKVAIALVDSYSHFIERGQLRPETGRDLEPVLTVFARSTDDARWRQAADRLLQAVLDRREGEILLRNFRFDDWFNAEDDTELDALLLTVAARRGDVASCTALVQAYGNLASSVATPAILLRHGLLEQAGTWLAAYQDGMVAAPRGVRFDDRIAAALPDLLANIDDEADQLRVAVFINGLPDDQSNTGPHRWQRLRALAPALLTTTQMPERQRRECLALVGSDTQGLATLTPLLIDRWPSLTELQLAEESDDIFGCAIERQLRVLRLLVGDAPACRRTLTRLIQADRHPAYRMRQRLLIRGRAMLLRQLQERRDPAVAGLPTVLLAALDDEEALKRHRGLSGLLLIIGLADRGGALAQWWQACDEERAEAVQRQCRSGGLEVITAVASSPAWREQRAALLERIYGDATLWHIIGENLSHTQRLAQAGILQPGEVMSLLPVLTQRRLPVETWDRLATLPQACDETAIPIRFWQQVIAAEAQLDQAADRPRRHDALYGYLIEALLDDGQVDEAMKLFNKQTDWHWSGRLRRLAKRLRTAAEEND